jgi:hypothetical protein
MRRYPYLGFLVLNLFLLTISCSGNPLSKDSSNPSGNLAGPVIGGAAAVAGTAALGAPRPLIYGAGLGGIALGYYMTTLRFDAGPIIKIGGDVYTQGDYVGISIPAYKLFEVHSAELLPQAEPLLNSAIAVLKRYPNANIMISGNSSGFNSAHDDQKLSAARAQKIAAYLWAHGINNFKGQSINSRKLTFVGYGDYFPISSGPNKQKNSRIQITGYPSAADLKIDQKSTLFNNIGASTDGG